MRALLPVLLAAAAAAAQDAAPILQATGDDLASFGVAFHADRVRHDSPRALAESFAALRRDQARVNRAFMRAFREEHLAVLARYYAAGPVAKQRAGYRAGEAEDADVSVAVGTVSLEGDDRARATLETTSRDPQGEAVTRSVLLTMKRADGAWRLVSVHDDVDGSWVKRDLGVPPVRPVADVPEPAAADRSAPHRTLESLRADVRRLAVLGDRGRHALAARFFDILRAFYGEKAEKRARADRPEVPEPPAAAWELADPRPRREGGVRVAATLLETGAEGRAPIAEAAFDLEETSDGWRVVAEHVREKADGPLEPQDNFGFLFLVFGG